MLTLETDNPVERSLIVALQALAEGRLTAITEAALPPREAALRPGVADTGASALYLKILEPIRKV